MHSSDVRRAGADEGHGSLANAGSQAERLQGHQIKSGNPKGQIYANFLLILAAAESAVGLGLLIVLYRFGNSIEFQEYQKLKG